MQIWDQVEWWQVLEAWLGMARPRWGPHMAEGGHPRPLWARSRGSPGAGVYHWARCGNSLGTSGGRALIFRSLLRRPQAIKTPARPQQTRKAVCSSSPDQQHMLRPLSSLGLCSLGLGAKKGDPSRVREAKAVFGDTV